jgi:DHA1 family bicyclomycin/chloramphenicol resistance-like MFS transporter
LNAICWTEKQCLWFLVPLIISISFAMDIFVPAIPSMSYFFRVNESVMQATLYVFMLTVCIANLIIGPLADRYGRRHTVISAALLFFLGSLLALFSHTILLLIIARIIQAIGACGTYLLCFVIVRDNFSTLACARLFSVLAGINALVASVAPVIGGFLIDFTHNWHSNFYFLTLLGLVMTVIAWRNLPNYAYDYQKLSLINTFIIMKVIAKNAYFRHYAPIAAIALLGLYLFCALSPGILISQLHLSATRYGLWFGLNALTVFIMNIIALHLTRYCALEKIVLLGLSIIISACLMMIYLNYSQLTSLHFMLPMLCMTIGISLSMGSAMALSLNDFKQQAGNAATLVGVYQFGLAGIMGLLTAQFKSSPLVLALSVLFFSFFAIARLLLYYHKVGWALTHHQR